MVGLLLLLLAESSPPTPLERVVHVDVIEFNAVRTGQRDRDFDQWIFWRWRDHRDKHGLKCGRFDVVAWRMAGKCATRPEYDHRRRKWFLRWCERDRMITVWATSYRRTVTGFDVEVDQRSVLASDRRQGLW